MIKIEVSHVCTKCVNCAFLRLDQNDNFFCSLVHDTPGKGAHLLLHLKRTHTNVNIDDPKCSGRSDKISLPAVIDAISAQARHFNRGLIGFSTICLSQSSILLVDKLKAYLRAGSTVLELSFATPADLLDFKLTEADLSKIRKFYKVTIHAPWQDIEYFDGTGITNPVIDKIIELGKLFPISGVVFHPDIIRNFNGLDVIPLPVLIENMGANKKFGRSIEDIEKIKNRHDFRFVLDLQHAYEYDPSLGLAHQLISVMGDRISHLHVSGQNQNSHHRPVYQADNKKAICQLLRAMPSVPVILEGLILGDIGATTKREIFYVTENGDPLHK